MLFLWSATNQTGHTHPLHEAKTRLPWSTSARCAIFTQHKPELELPLDLVGRVAIVIPNGYFEILKMVLISLCCCFVLEMSTPN